jgi:hypothetical protein
MFIETRSVVGLSTLLGDLSIPGSGWNGLLDKWYSPFFVRVTPDVISLQLCTLKVVGV